MKKIFQLINSWNFFKILIWKAEKKGFVYGGGNVSCWKIESGKNKNSFSLINSKFKCYKFIVM